MPLIGKNADYFFAFHRTGGPYQASRQGRAASSSMELFKGGWGQCYQQANADVLIHLPCLPVLPPAPVSFISRSNILQEDYSIARASNSFSMISFATRNLLGGRWESLEHSPWSSDMRSCCALLSNGSNTNTSVEIDIASLIRRNVDSDTPTLPHPIAETCLTPELINSIRDSCVKPTYL